MKDGFVKSPAPGEQISSVTPDGPHRDESDDAVRELEVSADIYAHRSSTRKALHRGDWWIAIGVYLLLASVAFVIF